MNRELDEYVYTKSIYTKLYIFKLHEYFKKSGNSRIRMAKNMFCTDCGKEINETARFCGYCGYDLTGKKEETIAFDEKEMKADENPKKITLVTGLLLTLLGIKFVGMLFMTFDDPINVIEMIIYLVIILGVLSKAKWGSLLAMGFSVLVIVAQLLVPAPTLVLGREITYPTAYIAGAIIMQSLIFILAWKEYNVIKNFRTIKESSYY